MRLYGDKIEGMTFPKFKKEYRKRLERLKVRDFMIDVVCKYRTIDRLSQMTFKKSGESLDWFICREVFNEMLKELNVGITIGHSTWYKEEYMERLKEIEKHEKTIEL